MDAAFVDWKAAESKVATCSSAAVWGEICAWCFGGIGQHKSTASNSLRMCIATK